MKSILTGKINDFIPAFKASIENGRLIFFSNKGDLALTVDTGFNDYFALPEKILSKLNLEYVAYETFVLADGKCVDIKTYRGEVTVDGKILPTLFIEGDCLIGMRFLQQIGTKLIVDFLKNKVGLFKRKN